MKVLTLGCDPEVFLTDKKKGIIPSCGLIGGTKETGLDIGKGVKILEDNVTLEFNTEPVVYEPDGNKLTASVQGALEHISDYLRKKNKGWGFEVMPSYRFPEDQLQNELARTFGCEPDLDAYTQGGVNPTFNADQVGNLRMAGGHIHAGIPEDVQIPKWALVQLVDALVTFYYYHAISRDVIGVERQLFYGRPGAYREKPYGIEYRTLSNYWLESPSIAEDVADTIWWAINYEAETKTVYDMINFNTVKRYFDGQLNGDQRDNLYRLIMRLREKVQSRIPRKKRAEDIVVPNTQRVPRIRFNPDPDFVAFRGLGDVGAAAPRVR